MRCLIRSYIELNLPLLIDAAFAAGAAMISFGAVLGKVSPAQITLLLILQVPIYAFNAHLSTEVSSHYFFPPKNTFLYSAVYPSLAVYWCLNRLGKALVLCALSGSVILVREVSRV